LPDTRINIEINRGDKLDERELLIYGKGSRYEEIVRELSEQ